jgi:hypothetical protein
VWYSEPGVGCFEPTRPSIRLRGTDVDFTCEWQLFEPVEGLDRRMGVLTIQLSNPAPGQIYDIRVPESEPRSAEPAAFRWATLPTSIGNGVTFLMASCYWLPGDKGGAYAAAVKDLVKRERPSFKLLLGDQVYLDWPLSWRPWKGIPRSLADRYLEYWGSQPYQDVLRATPNFFACDDHEFWNNYPDGQPHLPYTWLERDRAESTDVALTLYDRFQSGLNPGGQTFFDFSIGEVSFFVADPRSRRTPFDADDPHFFGEEQWSALEAWGESLKGPGVLVIGQPLFQEAGDWKDRSLLSFRDDYLRLCAVIRGALTRPTPHDILVLTGDIHVGRHATGWLRGVTPPSPVHEFVASPASRIGPDVPPKLFGVRAEPAPGILSVPDAIVWEVETSTTRDAPTIDNNIAVVHMSRGTNDRVRFGLSLWRVSRYSPRAPWLVPEEESGRASQVPLFHKEIELR